ncbi:glycosyltransferase family 4 protein [Arenibacter sp. BSSL-BM3]|uniref:Glycosyltransferase family 4 protein n=1 Tax=Arenibacter arenosicollis TaxID=2762274 RepID=A0ABR7QTE5_9FLAO|nr:glycosyltransferase family 4 protein [Arenibacter arenosicollis]MBC8770461.1 glycosyltransferase family 4 protein [Arenibacter arenosicollis]
MEKPKVLVFGNFGYNHNELCGQTVKTRNVYELLKNKETRYFSEVAFFDTDSLNTNRLGLFQGLYHVIKADELFYLPATKNLAYIFPFIFILSKLFSTKIHFIVLGGWLGEYLENRPLYRKMFLKIDWIYPETDALCQCLESDFGLKKVKRLNNFRDTNFSPALKSTGKNIKLVFMARVHPLKGVETLFKLSQRLEGSNLKNVTIDMYGPIFEEYKEEFNALLNTANKNITYRGVLQPNEIYPVLSQYDMMLFPTQYYTEGFPGSILDAYISGTPVIASNWLYAPEFVDHTSGAVVDFNDENAFLNKVIELVNKPLLIDSLKQGARAKSYEFSSDKAWEVIKSCLFFNKQ